MDFPRYERKGAALTLALCALLAGCGGGEQLSEGNAETRQLGQSAPQRMTLRYADSTNTTDTSTDTTSTTRLDGYRDIPTCPASYSGAPAYGSVVGGYETITTVTFDNLSDCDQEQVPITFGQVFAEGHLPSRDPQDGLAVRFDGTLVPVQVDVKAKHADGSVRHAILTVVLPRLGARQSITLDLVRAAVTWPQAEDARVRLLAAGGTGGRLKLSLDGQEYLAEIDPKLTENSVDTWVSGPYATEWLISSPLIGPAGAHPHLAAQFAVRYYPHTKSSKVDVIVENNWSYEPGPRNLAYDVEFALGAQVVYTRAALTHYHHARWRKSFWMGTKPEVHVRHNRTYLQSTKAIPNFDPTVVPSSTTLTNLYSRWSSSATQPMAPGIVATAMPTTGGRPDIGPLPQWTAVYLTSMDKRAKEVTLGVGDLAGSWPVHYRDKNTGLPVSLDNYPYMTILGRPQDAYNPTTQQSEAFPLCGGDCSTSPYNYDPDSAHQPSLAYVPYLVTGEHYYLEELHFWANWNMLKDNPSYRGYKQGLVKSDQIRAQAWTLRTLGHAAYITPDAHPLKTYFTSRVKYNLDWYNANFVQGNPNNLGVLDGTNSFQSIAYRTASGDRTGLAPWQDDFFTWSVGYLTELGFSDARPILQWKSKFPILRMVAPGACWVDGAAYSLAVRPASTMPLYSTMAEVYRATMRNADGTAMTNSTGARYLDQPCGSQEQADWRTQKDIDDRVARPAWKAGEMTGYAGMPTGYPSNMQPALAVAATSGHAQGLSAWGVFMRRSVKPNYGDAPQFAIVPR